MADQSSNLDTSQEEDVDRAVAEKLFGCVNDEGSKDDEPDPTNKAGAEYH